jgi:hypothetical protein
MHFEAPALLRPAAAPSSLHSRAKRMEQLLGLARVPIRVNASARRRTDGRVPHSIAAKVVTTASAEDFRLGSVAIARESSAQMANLDLEKCSLSMPIDSNRHRYLIEGGARLNLMHTRTLRLLQLLLRTEVMECHTPRRQSRISEAVLY